MTPPEPSVRSEAKPEPPHPPTAGRSSWQWPITSILVVLIFAGASLYVFKSCRTFPGEALDKTAKVVQQVGRQLQQVASAFNQGTINTTFTSYATTLSGSQYLQFATVSQFETFTRKDESSTLWGYLPLPDVIVEATAPVTYTYYLDLNDRWDFLLHDGVILVTAPDIKFNKPAVDASRITYEIKKDSHFRNTKDATESLKSSITGLSYAKARSNIELVRETGRRQTEIFVQNWLARSFADGKNYPVKVRFRSEAQTNAPALIKNHD